ncbi:MAG: class I SAM-dependent methyltransferase [Sulfuriferula sp.]
MTETNNQAFSKIYDRHVWQGDSLSGPGSDAERTSEFRALLEKFLRSHEIRSVVDLGCGDWSYSQLIDWTGIKYIGIDAVDSVIEKNQRQHAKSNISFLSMDAACQGLPQADLLIVKEVLQHLPNQDVQSILTKAQTYPYAIFVNDISHHVRGTWKQLWRWQSICPTNTDISPGSYRLLALREPPFSLTATHLLSYQNEYKGYRWEKEVLAWTQSK